MECGGRRVLNLHSAIHLRRSSPTFSTAITTTLPTRRRPCSWLLSAKSRRPNSPMRSLCSPPPPSTFCSSYSQNTVVTGIGGDDAFGGESSEKRGQRLLNVVLVSPQIAGNTGCIARTCAASSVSLHLVEPLGYKVDDTKLKRAGLDYWPYVVVKIHSSWEEFVDFFRKQDDKKRLLAFTKKGAKIHSEFSYRPGDWLVFGSETSGLPPETLHDCNSEKLGGGTIRIPMVETYVRCLNLSVSVGIALYEASRQLNYEQMQCPPNAINADDDRLFISEDIYT